MDEASRKAFRERERLKRFGPEVESTYPMIPYPKDAKITVKQVAYLHEYCKQTPTEIVRRFPKHLSLGQVHLALAHYHLTEKKAIDAELAAEFRVNAKDALLEGSLSLPSARPSFAEMTRHEAAPVPPVKNRRPAAVPQNPILEKKRGRDFAALLTNFWRSSGTES